MGSRRKENVTRVTHQKPARGTTENLMKGNGDQQNPPRVVHNASEIVRVTGREKVTDPEMAIDHGMATCRKRVIGAETAT